MMSKDKNSECCQAFIDLLAITKEKELEKGLIPTANHYEILGK